MSSVQGFVAKVFVKNGKGRNGKPYTAYSLRLEDDNGGEIDQWFGCGFNRPETADGTEIQEGDYVRFDTVEENGRTNVAKDADGKAVIQRKKNPPARQGGGSAAAGGKGGGAQPAIHYQNSRTAAIQLVEVLLANEALPVTAGKNKGDKVKRYDEVLAFVDKLTVQFFLDLETAGEDGPFRLLDSVADGRSGEVTADDLPDDALFSEEEVAEHEAEVAEPAGSEDDFE